MNIRKIPIINILVKKIDSLHRSFLRKENELFLLSQSNIDNRLKSKKINKEKINVVFVCWRPSVWGALKSVYDSFKADDLFNVTIVTIPNKKLLPKVGLDHNEFVSEGAEDFFINEKCIHGYDYEDGKWLDLYSLQPDYIFFQQPYNGERCEQYKSWYVSKYAKICYVHYASDFIGQTKTDVLAETTPRDFFYNTTYYFTQNEIDNRLISELLSKQDNFVTKTILTGYPKYDGLQKYIMSESNVWRFKREDNKFRIIWTPRWCTEEGTCHFFTYKDDFISYAKENPDIDFIFRPHPQAYKNWNATGEFTNEQIENYCKLYEQSDNMSIDYNKEYLSTFYSSDCLVTDISSIVAEYFLTGKPIIYCHRVDCFNDFSKELSKSFYWVRNWQELQKTLNELRLGVDPLKEKRNELRAKMFPNIENNAGEIIKNIIKQDALK